MATPCKQTMADKQKLSKEELFAMDAKHNTPLYQALPVVASRAEGVYIYDNEGKRYFDFLACFGAVNQGHRHPKIMEAVKEQLDFMTLCSRAYHCDMLAIYSKVVTEFFGYQRMIPMNTGVEAAETALKVARKWGYAKKKIPDLQAKIIFADGNFWGRTISAVSASTTPSTYEGFGPFTPGFVTIPYDDIPALEAVLEKDGKNTAAFFIEPIQGEAGVRVPSVGYLTTAKALCEKHNVLFIADEIQTGLGRTGKMLCCDHEGVRPDVLVLGKALSGGYYPVSIVLADDHIMLAMTVGSHGSTYGGNPLGCAAAIAALGVLREEKLAENAEMVGKYFRAEIETLKDTLPWICSVRGKGLMNAIEVSSSLGVNAWDICIELMKAGLLAKPTHDHHIRFTPPLCITKEQMKEALQIIKSVLIALGKA